MLKRTPIYGYHVKHGNMVEYAGYELPVWYEGIVNESRSVREHAGIFDVSHMGRVIVEGQDAARYLDRLTTNEVAKLRVGQGHYSLLLNPRGGVIDDITVFRTGQSRFLVVYNAANREKNWEWLRKNRASDSIELDDVSDSVAMFAVQGPRAGNVLKSLSGVRLDSIEKYSSTDANIDKIQCLVTRTGYTGEDGFEIYVWNNASQRPDAATQVWNLFLERGRDQGLHPAGLGARDVLRLEAGMCLYGNDIDEETTPVEARLMFVTRLSKKQNFTGRDVVENQKRTGPNRIRVGFKMIGKGIPRKEQKIMVDNEEVGVVTSGTLSPVLSEGIGMGYVKPDYSEVGQSLMVRIRDRDVPGTVVKLPFYQHRSEDKLIVYGEEIGLAEFRSSRTMKH